MTSWVPASQKQIGLVFNRPDDPRIVVRRSLAFRLPLARTIRSSGLRRNPSAFGAIDRRQVADKN
jgi:hypothetical protein